MARIWLPDGSSHSIAWEGGRMPAVLKAEDVRAGRHRVEDESGLAVAPATDDAVLLGGASIVLWITDRGAPPIRPTKDVDVVVEVMDAPCVL